MRPPRGRQRLVARLHQMELLRAHALLFFLGMCALSCLCAAANVRRSASHSVSGVPFGRACFALMLPFVLQGWRHPGPRDCALPADEAGLLGAAGARHRHLRGPPRVPRLGRPRRQGTPTCCASCNISKCEVCTEAWLTTSGAPVSTALFGRHAYTTPLLIVRRNAAHFSASSVVLFVFCTSALAKRMMLCIRPASCQQRRLMVCVQGVFTLRDDYLPGDLSCAHAPCCAVRLLRCACCDVFLPYFPPFTSSMYICCN